MLRRVLQAIHPREALWLVPFLCICLTALGLFRPLPRIPPPAHSRTVVGSDGVPVQIAVPLRGIALAPGYLFTNWYLEDTHSPKLLMYAGGSGQRRWFSGTVMSWIYPETLRNENIWDTKLFRNADNPYLEIESLLAYDPGVYLGASGTQDLMRRVSLPALSNWGHEKNGENIYFSTLRVDFALLGHPEIAEEKIGAYQQFFTDLQRELQPSSLANRPRALTMSVSNRDSSGISVIGGRSEYATLYYPNAGLEDASTSGHGDDAERVLAIDPDIIYLMTALVPSTQSPQQFMQDPRWQGLKAVRDMRVYKIPGGLAWLPGGIVFKPIEIRWMAEIAHPERLQPKTRALLRDGLINQFGYRLSDDQIDYLLRIEENSGSIGAERFTRDYQATQQEGLSK